ncbi:MAG: hypothetical protein U5L45_12485 [Saprospiraceae bacterium]|nr:hypothetical protein [Saprospiraceae bacterium]
MVRFSGKARKTNHIPTLARAKRTREPAVWILCTVSNHRNRKNHSSELSFYIF